MFAQKSMKRDFCDGIITYTGLISITAGLTLFLFWNLNLIGVTDSFNLINSTNLKSATLLIFSGIGLLMQHPKMSQYKKTYWVILVIHILIATSVYSQKLFEFLGFHTLLPTFQNPYIWNSTDDIHNSNSNVFIYISLGILLAKSSYSFLRSLSQYAFHITGVITFISLVTYLYNLPGLYQFTLLQTDSVFITVIQFLIGCAGSRINETQGITPLFIGNKIGNVMFRRIFPYTVIIVTFQGLLRVFLFKSELITIEFGITVAVISFLTIAFLILRSTALYLNRIDSKRVEAEKALIELNNSLEREVHARTAALKLSEEKFHKAFRMSPAGMVIADINSGQIMEVNNQFEQLTQYSNSELIGQTIMVLEMISPFTLAKIYSKIKKDRKTTGLEIEYFDKNHHKRTSLISLDIIEIFNSEYAITTLYDITERIEIEKKLLANTIEKEQFIANLSHEIRTPMNAIVGFSNLVETSKLSKKNQEYIGFIKTCSENLTVLINDILDYSKIEAGMMKLESIPFSLRELLKTMEMMFKLKITEKSLAFNIDIDKNLPDQIIGDPTRLTQILTNLIGNAVKFTKIGNISIVVKLHKVTGDTIEISFKIKDTGIGIDLDRQEEIFNRYVQATSEINRGYGGSGLGLMIVKNLVNIQNGTIQLQSKIGFGSEFDLVLPYQFLAEECVEGSTALASISESVDSSKREVRVLVVEDNYINQFLARKFLQQNGFEVEIAENGQIGIDKLSSTKYDIVLMDIQMPVMDGYTATKWIRNKMGSQIPVIAMTANSLPGEREKCLRLGMSDYISKPYDQDTLVSVINRHTIALTAPHGPAIAN